MGNGNASSQAMPGDEMNLSSAQTDEPVKTGRTLVLFGPGQSNQGEKVLKKAGVQLATTGNAENGQANRIYSEISVAVIESDSADVSSIKSANAEAGSPIVMLADETVIGIDPKVGVQQSETTATWGLDATNVTNSTFSGKGIKVAILDTGFDQNHPDFRGRSIIYKSFVSEAVQDGHGHGTHCTGTACGAKDRGGRRYGIAYEAEIYIGKVLGNNGNGVDGSIIAGINWAVEQGCHIISMSIGGLVAHGEGYPDFYEEVAYRALEKGTLIIAAAGNDSKRDWIPSVINPVSRPGNCPSILAVGAVDKFYSIARFSNGAKSFKNAGKVAIAGPGVDVYSSWPMNRQYNTISGTSMATPHVAGIAALYAEAVEGVRGQALRELLIKNVQTLPNLDQSDVGAGLIQAPKKK